MQASNPIGIFDSGIGGMTVARAINQILPYENLIYFGDTAHLPYGDKSAESIRAYALGITQFLLQKQCKIIVIACNSASTAAYEDVFNFVGNKALVLNVIDPIVEFINLNYSNIQIGLIGTKQTINSKTYEKKITSLNKNINLKSLATPLLAHLIEEGFYHNKISKEVIEEYLSNQELEGIQSLILGCTHYPLIKNEIAEFYNHRLDILDSANIVAEKLKLILKENNLENTSSNYFDNQFYVSDYTKSFEESTKVFFGEKIKLEHYPLWK